MVEFLKLGGFMDDAHLIVISKEIDELLAAICVKHQIGPLSLAAIINARLIWACRENGSEDDYHKLLGSIQQKQYDNFNPSITH